MENILAMVRDFGLFHLQWGQGIMILVGLVLLYLAIVKRFEPLLLVPIGFGGILSNLPDAGLAMSAIENAVCGQTGSDDGVFRSAATQLLHACRHQASLEQRNATADDHLAPAR